MRSYLLSQLYSKSLSSVMNIIIPRFYSIHNLNSKVGQPIKDVKDSVTFPYSQNLCSDRIEGKGIYLIDNGLEIYLWISKKSDPELLQSLFGNNYDAIISGKVIYIFIYLIIIIIYLYNKNVLLYIIIYYYMLLLLFIIIYYYILSQILFF